MDTAVNVTLFIKQLLILWFAGSFIFAGLLCIINLMLKQQGMSLFTTRGDDEQ